MDIPGLLIPETLCINELKCEDNTVIVYADTCSASARCPWCQQLSNRVHCRYNRTLADLPWAGQQVYWRVTVRKFYCTNGHCSGKVFAQRLDKVARVYSRRTVRQQQALEAIGFALGGEAGARLATQLGFPVSPDTLLRHLRQAPEPMVVPPAVLGVDDWAWKRGHRYGTILVDLERRQVIDLLPDRNPESFADWLLGQSNVRVISRDRGGEYREGARRGAPDAVQVADRFHLLKNLSEVIEKVFKGYSALLARIPRPTSRPRMLSPPRAHREEAREGTRQKIAQRSQLVHSLAQQGMSISAIARASGLHRQTVGRYLRAKSVPERPRRRARASTLAPYEGYILERCKQGYWNAMGLWREIVALGYPGKYKNVGRLVTYFRRLAREGVALQAPVEGLTVRKAVGLLLRESEKRNEKEQATIQALAALQPEIGRTVTLLEWFTRIVRNRESEQLAEWMAEAEDSGIAEMKGFVVKLRQDLDAVLAGLTLPWSQGQTEGQVTKLKLLRRQMYGRGNFDLVRKRLLGAA
jgi:transposase